MAWNGATQHAHKEGWKTAHGEGFTGEGVRAFERGQGADRQVVGLDRKEKKVWSGLHHPKQGPNVLGRGGLETKEVKEVFKNPRAHLNPQEWVRTKMDGKQNLGEAVAQANKKW